MENLYNDVFNIVYGYLDSDDQAYFDKRFGDIKDLAMFASRIGDITLLSKYQWLDTMEDGYHKYYLCYLEAAKCGHLHLMRWIARKYVIEFIWVDRRGIEFSDIYAYEKILDAKLAVVKYLVRQGMEIPNTVKFSNKKVRKWLRKRHRLSV